jgi:hypothetical protein
MVILQGQTVTQNGTLVPPILIPPNQWTQMQNMYAQGQSMSQIANSVQLTWNGTTDTLANIIQAYNQFVSNNGGYVNPNQQSNLQLTNALNQLQNIINNPNYNNVGGPAPSGLSPVWIVLIVLLIVGVIGFIAYYMSKHKK